MLNPDGVVHGNYRRDVFGVDLNRTWAEPKENETPSIHHCVELMKKLDDTSGHKLEIFLDVHAHSATLSNFFIANTDVENVNNERFLK